MDRNRPPGGRLLDASYPLPWGRMTGVRRLRAFALVCHGHGLLRFELLSIVDSTSVLTSVRPGEASSSEQEQGDTLPSPCRSPRGSWAILRPRASLPRSSPRVVGLDLVRVVSNFQTLAISFGHLACIPGMPMLKPSMRGEDASLGTMGADVTEGFRGRASPARAVLPQDRFSGRGMDDYLHGVCSPPALRCLASSQERTTAGPDAFSLAEHSGSPIHFLTAPGTGG